jgi:hypothetical protein
LNDTIERLFKRYIAEGGYAAPPAGFAQMTGYFVSYRMIETCVQKGMSLEEICSLTSDEVISRSEYFIENPPE